jgi:hypothetical protein
MDLACFPNGLSNIVGRRATVEVDGNGMLSSRDVDNRWRRSEKGRVLGEFVNAQGCRHDDQSQGLCMSPFVNVS